MRSYLMACIAVFFTMTNSDAEKFDLYGHWCGPDHPKFEDLKNPQPPIDELDTICMRHDKCYEELGYFSCACDDALLEQIKMQMNTQSYNKKQSAFARGIKLHFAVSPCEGDIRNSEHKILATKILTGVLTGVYGKSKAISESVYEKTKRTAGSILQRSKEKAIPLIKKGKEVLSNVYAKSKQAVQNVINKPIENKKAE